MSTIQNDAPGFKAQIPVTFYDENVAAAACKRLNALQRAVHTCPELLDDPRFMSLLEKTKAQYISAFIAGSE